MKARKNCKILYVWHQKNMRYSNQNALNHLVILKKGIYLIKGSHNFNFINKEIHFWKCLFALKGYYHALLQRY